MLSNMAIQRGTDQAQGHSEVVVSDPPERSEIPFGTGAPHRVSPLERLRGRGLASAVLQPKDAAEPALLDPVTRAHQRGARCGSVNNAPDIRFGPASLRLLEIGGPGGSQTLTIPNP